MCNYYGAALALKMSSIKNDYKKVKLLDKAYKFLLS